VRKNDARSHPDDVDVERWVREIRAAPHWVGNRAHSVRHDSHSFGCAQ
jgi:hypothetical protein